jgi:Ca2+-binding EF-hand superfamily protein
MVDSSKIGSGLRVWAGEGSLLTSREFKFALMRADSDKNGSLSRSEFKAVASELGLSSSEADSFYDKAKGSGDEVSISGLVSAADDFNATDGKWTADEFQSLVSDYTTKSGGSVFSDLAGDDVLDRDEMQAVVDGANEDCSDCISQEEFSAIAEKLGIEDSDSEAVKSAFKDITGDRSSATPDEVMAYFSAFADKNGGYTESAFDSLVKNLSGASDAAEDCGCAEDKADTTESSSSSSPSSSTSSSSSSTSTADSAEADTGISDADFEHIAGGEGIVQRDELEALLGKVDALQDGKLTKEEFRSAAIRMGVDPKNDANIDAVFDLIANGKSSITTGEALAYFGGMNGGDNEWSRAEYDAVLDRLGKGPDAAATDDETCAADETTAATGPATTDAAGAEDCEDVATPDNSEAYHRIGGQYDEIQRPEFRAALKESDENGDKKLTKSEFMDFAQELGVPFGNKAEVHEIFDIISNGKPEITINQALKYLDQFKGDDKTWNEGEFDDIVARLTDGAPSVFSSLAKDGVITAATLKEQFNKADGNHNHRLDASEFATLAANLGVDALKDGVFSSIAGKGDMSLADFTGYANTLGSATGGATTWTETQFTSLVDGLSSKES